MNKVPKTCCTQCGSEVSLDDAVHADELVGHFCGEKCAIACLRENPHIRPFSQIAQGGESGAQLGCLDESCRQEVDDEYPRPVEGDWK